MLINLNGIQSLFLFVVFGLHTSEFSDDSSSYFCLVLSGVHFFRSQMITWWLLLSYIFSCNYSNQYYQTQSIHLLKTGESCWFRISQSNENTQFDEWIKMKSLISLIFPFLSFLTSLVHFMLITRMYLYNKIINLIIKYQVVLMAQVDGVMSIESDQRLW